MGDIIEDMFVGFLVLCLLAFIAGMLGLAGVPMTLNTLAWVVGIIVVSWVVGHFINNVL